MTKNASVTCFVPTRGKRKAIHPGVDSTVKGDFLPRLEWYFTHGAFFSEPCFKKKTRTVEPMPVLRSKIRIQYHVAEGGTVGELDLKEVRNHVGICQKENE